MYIYLPFNNIMCYYQTVIIQNILKEKKFKLPIYLICVPQVWFMCFERSKIHDDIILIIIMHVYFQMPKKKKSN